MKRNKTIKHVLNLRAPVTLGCCGLALLVLLSGPPGQAAPQQQDAQQVPDFSRPPSQDNAPLGAQPSFRDAAGQAPAAQQQQVVATNPPALAAGGAATPAPILPQTTAPTTASPYKLATSIPELDFNKDISDYDKELLSSLRFYPASSSNQTGGAPAALVESDAGEQYEKSLINRFHNYKQMHEYLEQLAQAYPRVTRLYDVGQSVEGRKLWVLEISEQPGRHEPLKPEFRYIANVHGNEIVGRELLLHLARLILENYHHEESAADASRPTGVKFIKKLVKATRILLMPSMNPDGYERSDVGCKYEVPSKRGRLNANNVDLNRNFPDKLLGTQVDAGTQPEVRAIINWSRSESAVLSASLHGGALVANIPYDNVRNVTAAAAAAGNLSVNPIYLSLASGPAQERRSPDHETYMELARAYTLMHPTMWRGEMCYDKCTDYHPEVFPNDGITTGSGWYPVDGGMQDWLYENTNEFHITLELGCNQYPPAEALHQYWQFNKASMLSYMRQVHRGIKGLIQDASSARPLGQVNVHVRSIDHNVTSTPDGDYFRLLAPGKYQVLFERADYLPVEIFVSVDKTMAQVHSIKMVARNATDAAKHPPSNNSSSSSSGTTSSEHIAPIDAISPGEEPSSSQDNQHSIAVATLVMTIITLLMLVLLAGAYVIQKRRFSRSQSVSVELQPSGRSAAGSTGVSLPLASTIKATSGGGGGGGGRSSLMSPERGAC